MKNKMNKSQLPNKIRYEYQEESNLAMQYAHGVWGESIPKGKLKSIFIPNKIKFPQIPNAISNQTVRSDRK